MEKSYPTYYKKEGMNHEESILFIFYTCYDLSIAN